MFPILPPNEYRRREDIGRLLQRTTHAFGVPAAAAFVVNRFRRATGDVGLLRDRFRDHLGFLVSHDRLLSEGISLIAAASAPRSRRGLYFRRGNLFPGSRTIVFAGKETGNGQ